MIFFKVSKEKEEKPKKLFKYEKVQIEKYVILPLTRVLKVCVWSATGGR